MSMPAQLKVTTSLATLLLHSIDSVCIFHACVCMCDHEYVCMYICACICVCVHEQERSSIAIINSLTIIILNKHKNDIIKKL